MAAQAVRWGLATQGVRSLIASGRLGSIVRFEARLGESRPSRAEAEWRIRSERGSRAPDDPGVLVDPGIEVFALLASWLGPLTAVSHADDGAGGPEAEALACIATAAGVSGTVALSRLRPLADSIVVTGTQGHIAFDLRRSLLTAEPAGLLAEIDAAGASRHPAYGPAEREAVELISSLRLIRQRLVHVWEHAAPMAPEADADAARIAGRRVLVTGGTGFVGARLVEALAGHGANVTVATRSRRHIARVARLGVEIVAADLRAKALDEVVAGQDTVFGLAWDFRRSGAANVALQRNLADACARGGVRRYVHSSSIAVYDDWPSGNLDERSPCDAPGSDYKLAKRAIEIDLARRAAEGSLSVAVLQPTIVYGPFSAFWTDRFAERLLAGTIEVPPSGLGACNGVYVDDVVAAAIAAAVRDDAGSGPWIVSGAQPFDWTALLEGYARALGRKLERGAASDGAARPKRGRVDPLAIAAWAPARNAVAFLRDRIGDEQIDRLRERVVALAARSGAAVYRPAAADSSLYLARGRCDIGRARRELGYAPAFDLESGLTATCDYIRWRYVSDAAVGGTAEGGTASQTADR